MFLVAPPFPARQLSPPRQDNHAKLHQSKTPSQTDIPRLQRRRVMSSIRSSLEHKLRKTQSCDALNSATNFEAALETLDPEWSLFRPSKPRENTSTETYAQDEFNIEAAYLEALLNSMHNECITGKVSGVLDCKSNPSADEVDALQTKLYPDVPQSVSGLAKAYTTMTSGMGWMKNARSKPQAVTPGGTKVKSSIKSSHLLKRRKKVRFIKTVAAYGVDYGLTDGLAIEFLICERNGEAYYKQHLDLLEKHQRSRTSIADYNFDSTSGERPILTDSTVASYISYNVATARPIALGISFPDPEIASDATSRPVEQNRNLPHSEHHASIGMSIQPPFFDNLNVAPSETGSIVSTSDYEPSNLDRSSGGMVEHPVHSSQSTPPSSLTETSSESITSGPHTLPSRHDQQDYQPDVTPTAPPHAPADEYISLIPGSPYANEPKAGHAKQDDGRGSVMSLSDFLKQSRPQQYSPKATHGDHTPRHHGTLINESSVHPALRNGLRTYGSTPALREDLLSSLRRRAAGNRH